MKRRFIDLAIVACLALCASVLRAETMKIVLGAGKTHLIDTSVNIERVSVAEPLIAEAVPVSPRTLMINGKAPGDTSLVLWLNDGSRQEYDVNVRLAASRMEAAFTQIDGEFGGRVKMSVDNAAVYLTGTVTDTFESQRAVAIAESLGKVVNLLKIEVPPQETQILLKVRFANVDRSKATDWGVSFIGAPKGFPFSAHAGLPAGSGVGNIGGTGGTLTLADGLNLLFFDPQINVGATLKDLATRNVLQILAEPNLLALNGRQASFVAGGEFPFPTIQGGGAGVGQVTIQFRQFGVQIHFLPIITPRGTIRLHVNPEVSSLDYANALNVNGFTVPALATRKVDTEVELESGQTFAIAGLLDQRTTEQFSKMPGLADIPILGKLFTTRTTNTSNSELLIIITPELVSPIADPNKVPDLERPGKFMSGPGIMETPPRTPGTGVTGPVSAMPKRDSISVQEMQKFETDKAGAAAIAPAAGLMPGNPLGGGSTDPSAGAPSPAPPASSPLSQPDPAGARR